MTDTLALDRCANNTVPHNESEPELLVIHSPRVQQQSPWGEWARKTADWLKSEGWRVNRVGPDMHAVHPLMVQ